MSLSSVTCACLRKAAVVGNEVFIGQRATTFPGSSKAPHKADKARTAAPMGIFFISFLRCDRTAAKLIPLTRLFTRIRREVTVRIVRKYRGRMPTPSPTKPSEITPEVIAEHGITPDEYQKILSSLGRTPTRTELGIFSVMWSEHCSYKSSRVHLKRLPTRSKLVLQGPGENAGIIDIGDG